jgi:hypothetical protein
MIVNMLNLIKDLIVIVELFINIALMLIETDLIDIVDMINI